MLPPGGCESHRGVGSGLMARTLDGGSHNEGGMGERRFGGGGRVSVSPGPDEWVSTLRRLLAHPSSVAVGECGLDPQAQAWW